MSMISPYMVATSAAGQELTLTPQVGQSILVRRIMVSVTAAGPVTVEIGKSTVGFFRTKSQWGSHLTFPGTGNALSASGTNHFHNLLDWMLENTDFAGYPVGQGETFRVVGPVSSGTEISVEYQTFSAGDQLPSNANGSQSDVYHAVLYGQVPADLTAGGYHTVSKAINPAQFPTFPFGGAVPSNTEIDILGIVGMDGSAAGSAATDTHKTDYLKLTRDRTVLFDEDKNGIPFFGANNLAASQTAYGVGYSVIGNDTEFDPRPPFELTPSLKFMSGDDLLVQIHTVLAGAGATLSADGLTIGLVSRIHVRS